MEIENHKEEVPFAFYEEKFRALSPEEALSRLHIPCMRESVQQYCLPFVFPN